MHRRLGAVLLIVLISVTVLPTPVSAAEAQPPDPETDQLGWEGGYWYNESITVDQSDGLSDEELDAIVSRAMARVEHIRQLEFNQTVPVTLQSREEFAAEQRNRTTSPTLRVFDNAKFEALFMINESTDSIHVQERNAGSSILGYYHRGKDAIVLIANDQSQLEVDELVLGHELVHALQDQHFPPVTYGNMTRDDVNAASGIVEGDPKFVEHRYRERCQGGVWDGTCVSPASSSGGGSLANIGPYFLKYQPYADGPTFVNYVYSRGGWPAVNDVYEQPPVSSEQVIHPGKYGVDRPANVTLGDHTSDSWERVRPDGRPDYAEFGEAGMMTMFVYPIYDSNGRTQIVPLSNWLNRTPSGGLNQFDPLNYGSPYTAGWDGDRLHVYENDLDQTAYTWRSVWDSESDAIEFADGYRQVLAYHEAEQVAPDTYRIDSGGFEDAFHLDVDGNAVTIVNAPSVNELSTVRTNVTVQTTTPITTTEPTPVNQADDPTPKSPATSMIPPKTTSVAVTTSPGQPGFGILLVVAMLAIALWLRRS